MIPFSQKNNILSYIICVCPKKVVTLHRQIKKTSIMKATTKNLLTLKEAATQVKYLLSAVTRINGIKCPLSISQIMRLIEGSGNFLKLNVNKWTGSITTCQVEDTDMYIQISITYFFEDEKYIVNIL